jgi:hypothetical protein
MKYCWKCQTSKPKASFGLNKSKADGLATECKECKRHQDRQYAARNRDKAKENALDWYYKNHEYYSEEGLDFIWDLITLSLNYTKPNLFYRD